MENRAVGNKEGFIKKMERFVPLHNTKRTKNYEPRTLNYFKSIIFFVETNFSVTTWYMYIPEDTSDAFQLYL